MQHTGDDGDAEQRPADEPRLVGDDRDADRQQQDGGDELIGEDERVAVSAHGLGCGVPDGVGEAGNKHQPEGGEGQIFMTTVFVCVYSSKASIDFSRPYPDFLKPPKGSSTPPPAP